MPFMTIAERNELIDEIVNDHPELARNRTMLVQFLDAKGWADNAVQVFKYLNLVKSGGMLARLEGVLSTLSYPGLAEIAFIVETLEQIGQANLYAVKMLGKKAYAYGVTAWAFQHVMPALPAADAQKLREWSHDRRVEQAAAEWHKMGEAAMLAMTRRCTYERIYSSLFKEWMRSSFHNHPKELAESIYRGFEVGMTAFERGVHRSLPCDYPN